MSNLADTLAIAVPLCQIRLQAIPMDQLLTRTGEVGQLLAEHGDKLLFGSSKKGETANLFNKVAEGIAILSFLPGGVTLFGQHWEMKHE